MSLINILSSFWACLLKTWTIAIVLDRKGMMRVTQCCYLARWFFRFDANHHHFATRRHCPCKTFQIFDCMQGWKLWNLEQNSSLWNLYGSAQVHCWWLATQEIYRTVEMVQDNGTTTRQGWADVGSCMFAMMRQKCLIQQLWLKKL